MLGSPVARLMLVLGGLDVFFNLLLTYSYLPMMGIVDAPARNLTVAVAVTLSAVRVAIWCAYVGWRLRPVSRWRGLKKKKASPALVSAALRAAHAAPLAASLCWAVLFALAWVIVTGVLYFGFPETVPLGPHALSATAMLAMAVLMGASELSFPLVDWMLAPLVERLSLEAQELGAPSASDSVEGGPRAGLSFRTRIIAFALTLAAAPSIYLAAIIYMTT
jgi:hypothetical protein